MKCEHKAPPGKYIVGEADYDEDSWGQVGDPLDNLEEARAKAKEFNSNRKPSFSYHVYDEHGLI